MAGPAVWSRKMNLKSLRYFFTLGLLTVAGYSWATPSLPINDTTQWQNIKNIEWSTDNGTTWGTSSTITVGQSVEFKVTMDKTNIGNHFADFVKVWIDQNGSGTFDESESVLFDYRVANSTQQAWNNPERSYTGQPFSFISKAITVTSSMPSDLWVLARVTCSESLLKTGANDYVWSNQWSSTYTDLNNAKYYGTLFSPTAHYVQGESELVKLTVPEPGTLALFSVAMLGMGWIRKKTTRV